MADIQIGKNKYKVTLTILIGAFTVLVSSIGWVLSLQMTVAATEKDIAELKLQLSTIKEIEEIVASNHRKRDAFYHVRPFRIQRYIKRNGKRRVRRQERVWQL